MDRRWQLAAALLGAAALLVARPAAAEEADSLVTPVAAESVAAAPREALGNAPMMIGAQKALLTNRDGTVLRSGPGEQYAIVGVYPREKSFPIFAKSGPWLGVRISDTETGWVHSALVKVSDDLSGLQFRPNPKLYTRTGSYVLGGYGGAYAFDRKSNSFVAGGRLGYYVFDRLEAEAGVSWTHVRRPAEIVESLFALSLEAEDFSMLFYHFNLTYELLPGRQMVPYVTAGAGSGLMLGRSEPTVNFGAGTRLFLSKRSAVRWEVRDYRFHAKDDPSHLANHNVEFTIGSEVLY